MDRFIQFMKEAFKLSKLSFQLVKRNLKWFCSTELNWLCLISSFFKINMKINNLQFNAKLFNFKGWSLLMAPWFLVNAFGIFPLIPLIASSYYRCKSPFSFFFSFRINKPPICFCINTFADEDVKRGHKVFKFFWNIVSFMLGIGSKAAADS